MKWSATLPLWFGDGLQKLVSEELDRKMEISYIWLLNIIQVCRNLKKNNFENYYNNG